jgi:hypothetical protein
MGNPMDAITAWLEHPFSWVLLAILIIGVIIDHYRKV